MQTLYCVVVADLSYSGCPARKSAFVPLAQVPEVLATMLRDSTDPKITIERRERRVLTESDHGSTPAVLILAPWGTRIGQFNKINAIKVLRLADPRSLCLKDAKDLVEQGGEVFTPWDLNAETARILRDGMEKHQLYAVVCAREACDEDPIADIPQEFRY